MSTPTLYTIENADGPTRIPSNGIELGIFSAGPKDGLPVVFCHGFPELAYSWRAQITALANAGFRVFAPDMRGYGHSDQPIDVAAYTLANLCGDMEGLLDHYEIDRAVFVGHDWGGNVVWQMPLRYSDRVLGVAGLNMPFVPYHAARPAIEAFREKYGDEMYIVKFQEAKMAERILSADTEATMSFFMRKSNYTAKQFESAPKHARSLDFLGAIEHGDKAAWQSKAFLSKEELSVYSGTFAHNGFSGPVNWYRNFERNWRDDKGLPQLVEQPCLMIMADNDVVLPPSAADNMEHYVPNLSRHIVKDCGHWTMQEHPDEVNRVLIEWLNSTTF
ncbi:MAG: alpha/beta fold hydrolase [Gammaproteobacteria bacterium]